MVDAATSATSSKNVSYEAPSLPRPARRETTSTIGSEKHSRLPPGHYKLDIHGNCPKCHHHHSGATIRVKVTNEASHVSHVDCKNCNGRWLAFGGRNTTRISLLSTGTTEPDNVELDFRFTLISMVQSATSIASPTLSRVPEAAPHIASSYSFSQPPINGTDENVPQFQRSHDTFNRSETQAAITALASAHTGPTADTNSTMTPSAAPPISDPIRVRRGWHQLKRTLLKRVPNLHIPHLLRPGTSSKKPKMVKEANEKLFVKQDQSVGPPVAPKVLLQEPVGNELPITPDIHSERRKPQHRDPDTSIPSEGSELAEELMRRVDKDAIKKMTYQERVKWIREQFTTFKCRCTRNCSCRPNVRLSPPPMISMGTQVYSTELLQPLSPPLRRSRSSDLLGLGSHFGSFDVFAVSTHMPHHSPLSISFPRTSQAETVVDALTVSSAPRNSVQETFFPPRSITPISIPSRPQSWQPVFQNGLTATTSMESFTTGGAVRSIIGAGRAGTDRFTTPTPTATSISFATDTSRSELQDQATMADEALLSSDAQFLFPLASSERALYINGHRTSDEENLDSESDNDATPTQGTPPRINED